MGHYCSLQKSLITIISKVPQNDSMGTKVHQKKFHQNISTLSGTLLLGVIMGHYCSLQKSIITIISKVPQNDSMGTSLPKKFSSKYLNSKGCFVIRGNNGSLL